VYFFQYKLSDMMQRLCYRFWEACFKT